MDIGSISESLEDYLEIIYNLILDKGYARVKDIADRKNVSMASVNTALKRLEKVSLIEYESRGVVKLTEEGENLAGRVISRHEFVKNFLMSILGVPEDVAERDACIFEHHMSPETFRRFVGFFEFVNHCGLNIRERFQDYCNQVRKQHEVEFCPSKECPYREDARRHRKRLGRVKTLRELKPGETGRVVRIQAANSIRQRLIDMGVLPNVDVTLERIAPFGDPLEIKLRGYHLTLRGEEAESIIVVPKHD